MELDKKIKELPSAQRQRLAYIDFSLEYFGQISRIELSEHFDVGVTSCSRDFALYRKLAEYNLEFRHSGKQYVRTDSFQPLFKHNADTALENLTNGFGDGITEKHPINPNCFNAVQLIFCKQHIVASLMRAILSKSMIRITYNSLSSGTSERAIAPHAIFNAGKHWVVRAFDCNSNEFKDFICSRISASVYQSTQLATEQQSLSDLQWNNIVKLDLIPHPTQKYQKIIEQEYGMERGHKFVDIRQPLIGYFLRYWSVDFGQENELPLKQYLLFLNNSEILNNFEINMKAK